MSRPLGVGIIGCGEAAQAIHLPTLATLSNSFRIVHCMDLDPAVAAEVARRAGPETRSTTDLDTLLEDPDVDIVVVCSPDSVHAAHVTGACRAGKKAVLCEKPLAATVAAAQEIVDVSRETGVPVLVGTMHRYDPAFRAFESAHGDLLRDATVVRSVKYLAPNPVLVHAVTDPIAPTAGGPRGAPDTGGLPFETWLFRALMLGLAIHHLPLVRLAMPEVDTVEVAQPLGRRGYHVSLRSGGRVAQLTAVLFGFPYLEWELQLYGANAHARLEFPPSYLPAQATRATVTTRDGDYIVDRRHGGYYENGYRAEWLHIRDVIAGEAEPLTPAESGLADVALALRIADVAISAAQAGAA